MNEEQLLAAVQGLEKPQYPAVYFRAFWHRQDGNILVIRGVAKIDPASALRDLENINEETQDRFDLTFYETVTAPYEGSWVDATYFAE